MSSLVPFWVKDRSWPLLNCNLASHISFASGVSQALASLARLSASLWASLAQSHSDGNNGSLYQRWEMRSPGYVVYALITLYRDFYWDTVNPQRIPDSAISSSHVSQTPPTGLMMVFWVEMYRQQLSEVDGPGNDTQTNVMMDVFIQ